MAGRLESPDIALHDVCVGYGARVVLSGVETTLPGGKISVILGGSGCGKSTLLRNIVGLVPIKSGRIVLGGRDMALMEPRERLAVRRRMLKLTEQLRGEGHMVSDHVPLGAMIEVPAAALALESFIDLVDFLSIGTNDLVQYLLAADRNNEALGELYSPLHPAVLRLLQMVIETGARHRIPVAVCGEMAGDARMTPLLLALGLSEFSLHPGTLLEVRRAIREADLSVLRARAPKLLAARDRRAIERWLALVAETA